MNLILLKESDRLGTSFELSDHRAEHIISILKASVGDSIEVGLINGPLGTAQIESIDKTRVSLNNAQLTEPVTISPSVDLIVALPRPQTLKKVLAISATMAVRKLHLIRANRVEKSYYASPLLEAENLEKQLLEGMSQGRQTRMPEVTIHDRFKPFFQDTLPELEKKETRSAIKLLCDCDADSRSVSSAFTKQAEIITIAIGPEGGWVPFETELMQSVGFMPISLGRFTLRVESAVTAALAQLEQTLLVSKDKSQEIV